MYQIELKGNPILLLADQLIFLRYRHKNEVPAGGRIPLIGLEPNGPNTARNSQGARTPAPEITSHSSRRDG